MNAPNKLELRLQQFVDMCTSMSAQRRETADYELYEALKRDVETMNLSPQDYTVAVRAAARAAGV